MEMKKSNAAKGFMQVSVRDNCSELELNMVVCDWFTLYIDHPTAVIP
jgi:hypothetical protein